MYFTSGKDRAFERLMQEKPGFNHYDGGGANAPEDCGSCRFYRPDWKYQYCVYAECPYQPGKLTAFAAVKFTVKGADNDMAVFRVEKNKGYTVMSNHHLRNKALSLKAKGLLSQKLHRRTKAKRIRERKRVLGRSIEERPESVDSREEFGHWEIDEVIGRKSDKDKVLLTMVERKTRNLCVLRLADKSSRSLMEAFQRMEDELGQDFPKVFRSITADNGSENAILADIESVTGTPVYFTHPYTSCEKGTIENHNGLIRRFLPKGKRIDSYDEDAILGVELWANGLPRKILGYRTPDEAFEAEMDRIFAV